MKPNYNDAPVQDGYARDIVLEAVRLLLPTNEYAKNLVFVEFYEVPGFALIKEDSVVFYHPELIKSVSLDIVCKMIHEVFKAYAEPDDEDDMDFDVPEGTTFH